MIVHAFEVVELDLVEVTIFHEIILHLVDINPVFEPIESLSYLIVALEMLFNLVFDVELVIVLILHV